MRRKGLVTQDFGHQRVVDTGSIVHCPVRRRSRRKRKARKGRRNDMKRDGLSRRCLGFLDEFWYYCCELEER